MGLKQAGLDPEISAYRFCTNAAYSAGIAKIPTIGFGPGSEGSAHIVDEFISLNDLKKAAVGYQRMIESILRM